jgi:dTDP-4-dehydrorhamnose reductase
LKLLILGVSGLIGSIFFKVLSQDKNIQVFGTVRSNADKEYFLRIKPSYLIDSIDCNDNVGVKKLFENVKPDLVINCIGLTKHYKKIDMIDMIKVNALWPHELARLCDDFNAFLIQISTDCVFSGAKGSYTELDTPDAIDLYGRSKILGELNYFYGNTLTLRTSTIGHELKRHFGLLDWFLEQKKACKGYKKAIFSGLPTVALANIIRDHIIEDRNLKGLYHVGAEPISKFDLLNLIASVYNKDTFIEPDESFVIDRSLDCSKFSAHTGYMPLAWGNLVQLMYEFEKNG